MISNGFTFFVCTYDFIVFVICVCLSVVMYAYQCLCLSVHQIDKRLRKITCILVSIWDVSIFNVHLQK